MTLTLSTMNCDSIGHSEWSGSQLSNRTSSISWDARCVSLANLLVASWEGTWKLGWLYCNTTSLNPFGTCHYHISPDQTISFQLYERHAPKSVNDPNWKTILFIDSFLPANFTKDTKDELIDFKTRWVILEVYHILQPSEITDRRPEVKKLLLVFPGRASTTSFKVWPKYAL